MKDLQCQFVIDSAECSHQMIKDTMRFVGPKPTFFMKHPRHSFPAKFGCVLLYSPFLFGKKLFSMQD